MTDLSSEQIEKRASIQKSATIVGAIVGVIVALIALWALGGQGAAIRFGGAILVGGGVGFLAYRGSYKANAKSAACESCGAPFTRSRTDRTETPTGSEEKEAREDQEDGTTKVTTWIEETFDVTETFTCAKCNDVTTKTHSSSRRTDEEEMILQPSIKSGQPGSETPRDIEAVTAKLNKTGNSGGGKTAGRSGSSRGKKGD